MEIGWYVSAQNRTFGPYSHEQMKSFAQDRRLAPQSLVRRGDDGAFVPAETHAALVRFFEAEGRQSGEVIAVKASAPEARAKPVARVPEEGEASNFVIVVQLRAGSAREFEAAMGALGTSFRLNGQTWLLQSTSNANSIKLSLAPSIGAQDPILIVDAGRNRLAWHNFTVFDASRIRDIWRMPNERS
jgi:hypothetical protein